MNLKANLKAAIHQNDLHWVRQLLDHGADVNDRYTRNDTTPLISAAAAGHEEILRDLLERGADVNARTKDNYTALMAACEWDHPELAEILLEHGADVTVATTHSGRRFSLMEGEGSVFNSTVDSDPLGTPADPSYVPPFESDIPTLQPLNLATDTPLSGMSPQDDLQPSAENDFGQFKDGANRIALRNLEEGDEEPYGYTALIYACANNNLELVDHLIEHGAPVNDSTSKGETGISMACHHNHANTIQTLLNAGATPDTVITDTGLTVFMWACKNGAVRLVKNLLEHHVTLDITDQKRRSALFYAAQNGHNLIIRLLIEAGAQLDAGDIDGVTSLMIASSNGHVTIVESLLLAGANPLLRTERGQMALISAASRGRTNVLKKILEHPSFDITQHPDIKRIISSCLFPAIRNGHDNVVFALLDAGADANYCLEDSTTVLMEAAYLRENEIVSLLLQFGADPNDRDDLGSTALIKAAYEWPLHLQIPEHMNGPAGDVMVQAGHTTDKAQEEIEIPPNPRDTEHASITMKILLDAGANPNSYNNKGVSALSQRILAKDETGIRTLIAGRVDTTKCTREGRLSTEEIQVLDKHFPGIIGLFKKQEVQGTGAIKEIDETGF